jgi:tartrate-resistant acid phosphatase type 5
MRIVFCSVIWSLASCGTTTIGEKTDAAAIPSDTDTDADTDSDTDADTDSDTDADTDADTDTGPPAPAHVVRFIAMGDGGEGNTAQYEVADRVEQVCASKGCDFALYLGDNFYDDGVDSVDDAQFETKFEQPYAALNFPFYVVMGNHDYGLVPAEFWKADYEIEYTNHSSKWTMPDVSYTFVKEHVQFFGLDTNGVMFGVDWATGQQAWFDAEVAASTADWKIAYGHHPYISNGKHGNAGNYEGAWYDITGLVNGFYMKEFFDQSVCGKVDIYFAGHDHNRQILEPTCGTLFIVTGAAAKTTGFEHRDNNPTIWEDDTTEGFVWVEIADDAVTLEFYNRAGTLEYTSTFQP